MATNEQRNWNMIKKYLTCLTFRNSQSSEPIINHPIPNQAWTKVAADSFRLYGHYYIEFFYKQTTRIIF